MARIQERGQITLPKALREQAGLAAGDEVTITVTDEGLVVRRARTVFDFVGPTRAARGGAHQKAAEKSAWADAAGRDLPNRRPSAD